MLFCKSVAACFATHFVSAVLTTELCICVLFFVYLVLLKGPTPLLAKGRHASGHPHQASTGADLPRGSKQKDAKERFVLALSLGSLFHRVDADLRCLARDGVFDTNTLLFVC